MKYFIPLLCFHALYCGELIEKRGFIIKNEIGEFYLSSLPNLKSCCIGKKGESFKLIGQVAEGSPYTAVTLKGEVVVGLNETTFVLEGFAP